MNTRTGMLGIHRDEVDQISTKLPRSRILLVIVILAGIGFLNCKGASIISGYITTDTKVVAKGSLREFFIFGFRRKPHIQVCLTALSIYTGKRDIQNKMGIFFGPKNRFNMKVNDLGPFNDEYDNNITNTNEEILQSTILPTLLPGFMSTMDQQRPLSRTVDAVNLQEAFITTTTSDVEAASDVQRFIELAPEEEEEEEEEESNVTLSEQEIASRHSRAYPVEHKNRRTVSKANRSGRIVNRNQHHLVNQTFRFPHPSIASYSGPYAQLENYKHTNSQMKNIPGVLSFTTSKSSTTARPSQPTAVTVKSTKKGGSTIKFTGVYVKGPTEHLDGHISDGPVYVNPFLNGHAYATDPFVKYKPKHPSEINQLATSTLEIDTGPRFSNKVVRPTRTPQQEEIDSISSGTGTLTDAIFHPYETPEDENQKSRPLKIMLDVYPVMEDDFEDGYQNGRGIRSNKPQNQLKSGHKNRMLVHLNLYPKKTTKVRKRPSVLTSLLPGGGRFEERMINNENQVAGDEQILIEEYGVKQPGMEDISHDNNDKNPNDEDYFDDEYITTTATIITDGVSMAGDDVLANNYEHQPALTFDDVITSIKSFTDNLDGNNTHNTDNEDNKSSHNRK